MSERKDRKKPLQEGYQPVEKESQSKQGNLDTSNPPRSGSGVNSKGQSSGKEHKDEK